MQEPERRQCLALKRGIVRTQGSLNRELRVTQSALPVVDLGDAVGKSEVNLRRENVVTCGLLSAW